MATSSFVNAQLASCLANGLGSLCGATASSRMGGFGGFGGFGDLNSTGSSVYSTASSREHSISSIDSILSDMVSALEADNEPQCHECSETGVLAARCTSCEAVLCDACARAHQRLPVTMDHLLVRLDDALPYNMSVPPPSGAVVILPGFGGVPPPPPRSSRHSSRSPGAVRGAHSPTACEEHQGETVKVYCETCAAPICGVCIDSKTHHGHSLSYIQAAIEASRVTNMSYLADATSGAQTMQDRLDVTLKMVDAVDVKAKQVASEVRQASQRLVAAVEARERELLANVEKIRSLKSMSLLLQSETIRGLLKRFVRLADSLRDSLQQDSIDALHTKEKASVELTQLCAARANVTASGATPFEDDLLTFVPHEPLLVRAISSAGAVTSSPYALTTLAVGEGLSRATRGRQASFTVHIKNHLNEAATPGSVDYVEATLVAPNGGVTHADVEDRGDGSLTVVYQPRVEGPNTLNVTLRGRHIAGSPFQVAVRAVRTYDGLLPPVTFGGEGGDDGQLLRPWGICCDRQGRLIVADRSNNRIQVFQPDGTFLFKFGSQGKEPGQFDRPAGVAADAAGRIIVADKDNHRVQVFDSDGQFVLAFGEMGSNNGQFHYPWDVDANAAGQIVVSDTRNHRIQLFSPTGQFLKKYGWETSTTMWKHFDTPRGVSFNPNNFVIVTDFNNHRLVVVEPSFRNARFLGSEGTDVKQFMRPQGVVVDDSGNIIVADSRNNRVQVLESNGTFRCQIGLPDVQMDRPSGVCVTPEGRIAIVDFGNNRVVMC